MTVATPEAPPEPLPLRKPRKIFLVVGLVVAVVLGIGLFTSVGTTKTSGPPHQGGQVPSFTAARLNGVGTLAVPADGGGGGAPAALLFFGEWCHVCHTELPSLAAAVHTPLLGAYSASKAAVEALTDALRIEIRPTGARVGVAMDCGCCLENPALQPVITA